jgi:hypothetical protein
MTAHANPTRSHYVNEFGQPIFPKKVLIAIVPTMLWQIDHIARVESRTRSDLVREALRRYIAEFNRSTGAIPAYTRPVVLESEGTQQEVVTYRENASLAGVH